MRSTVITSEFAMIMLLGVVGCGSQQTPHLEPKKAAVHHAGQPVAQAPADDVEVEVAFQDAPAGEQKAKQAPVKKADQVARRIKYTADYSMIAEDFPKAADDLETLIKASDGFVSFADVQTSPGQPRFGIWKARVPVAKFDEFRKAVAKIAELQSSKVNTEDITGQYYDLENHIKNKKAQEEAMRELLRKTNDNIDRMLSVQRELAQIRDSIERSEGQLRLWGNLTDLTTVTIRIQERQKFVPDHPPATVERPGFGSRVSQTFGENWKSMTGVLGDFAVSLTALAPWLAIILPVGLLGWWSYRRIVRWAESPRGK